MGKVAAQARFGPRPNQNREGVVGGISVGGVIVMGIFLMIVSSFWLGLIVT